MGSIVIIHPIDVFQLKSDFLVIPHENTITICEVRIFVRVALINPIKIAYQTFFDFIFALKLTVYHKNFV